MKRKFTFLITAALMLLTMMARPVTVWGQAPVNTTLWKETWTGGAANTTPSNYIFSGTTVYGGATLTYAQSSTSTKLYDANLAGGTTPELLLAKSNTTWTISGIPSGSATGLTLTFKANYDRTEVSSTTTGITIGTKSFSDNTVTYPITVASTVSTFTLVFTNTTGSNVRIDDIELVVTTAGGGSDPTITLSDTGTGNIGNYAVNTEITRDFTVTQSNLTAPISLSATNGGTFTINNETITSIPAGDGSTEVTWHFTPTAAGQFSSEITATSGEVSATCTYMGYAYTLHNVNITQGIEHGTVEADPTSGIQGTYITLTVTPDQGYELEELTVLDGNNNEIEVNNLNRFQMPDSDVTVNATFVEAAPTTTVTDVLNYKFTGISGSSYQSWSDKTGTSGAVYAGNSNAGVSYIQLRSTSPSGIVSTTSGGKVKKVTVTWNSNTVNGRTLNVYGNNTAYEGSSDLYGSNAGTLLGTIVKGTSTELTVTGDYAYVGLRSASGAMYLDEIDIDWATSGTPTCAAPTFTPAAGTYYETQSVTIASATEGATIYYTLDGTDPTTSSSVYSSALSISETTTVKAMAVKEGMNNSTVATATYTIEAPLSTMQAIFDRATEIGSTAQTVNITFNNWVVSGKSTSYAYVTDGTKGFVINNYSGHGFNAGDVLSGTASCSLRLNYGYANLQNFTSSAEGLTVTPGGTVETANIEMASLSGVNSGALVHYENLTCSISDSKYYLTDGTTTIQVYTTLYSGFTSVLQDGKNYNITGVYQQYNTTKEVCPRSAADIVEYVGPSISIYPTTASLFTYIQGSGPSEEQVFEVTGTNLSSTDITAAITAGTSYFEITDNTAYGSSVTVESGDVISIRLKAGLAKGSYNGTLTLSSTDATDVEVSLSGSVTGQTYTINIDDAITGGTIAADLAAAEEGATVTLTATPDAAYTFGSWTVYQDDLTTAVPVTNNQFTMPACEVYVTATFTLKDTYAITCAVSPDGAADMEASPASAYEGQTVTLTYVAETGYNLSEIVITKTSDGSATGITPTASGDDYTFTMPDYAVTATATFISDTYYGSFVKFTGNAMEEGDYILVYNAKAMNNDNSTTSNKLGATDVVATGNIITDPSRSIVWHIAPIGTDGKWTIYNAVVNQYVNASGSGSTNITLVDNASYSNGAKWSITIDEENNTYDFSSLTTSRALRYLNSVFGHYATGNGGPLTLYKYTVLTERTITFHGNGGTLPSTSETTYTQTVYDGIATNLTANQFTKANSAFAGWALTADGDVEYADGASITVTGENLDLYAKWATSYTAMVDDAIVGGTVLINGEEIVEVAEGTEMNLTYNATLGYAFSAWNVYQDGDPTTTVNVENNAFTMPAYDVIVSASFVEATTYTLVTDASQIVSGKHYVIASGKTGTVRAMAGQTSNNRSSIEVTVSGTTINKTEGLYEFVINGPFEFKEKNCYTIYDNNTSSTGYLYAASSSSNYLRTKSTLDDDGKWTIAIDGETSAATIKAQGDYTHNWMRNNGNLFSCYASGQSDIYLYVKVNDNDYEYYGSEITYTGNAIPTGETITVGTGSVMTVPDSFENYDPANLIIENGGQLIHNESVSATIQKNVTGYARDNSGYQLISSPVESSLNVAAETNLATGTYDLYIFNQDQPSKEWRNYKAENADFNTIDNETGYLYANASNITISFAGTLRPSDEDATIDLNYTTGNRLAGWNLVGNPFACNAYIKGASSTEIAFYRMNAVGNGFVAATGAIAPMEGIFVQAKTTGQSFKFTREAPSGNAGKGNLNLQVAQVITDRDALTTYDNVIIRFDGGNSLEKFSFRDDNTKLFVPQDGNDYAVVNAQAFGEMPVNFKPAENGTYTIDFSMDNVEFNYLHLIDNKTGNNIDLLATPSYTFDAKVNDYASRFRLVFNTIANGNDSENENFAFISNGQIIITEDACDASLQIVDMTGRIIVCRDGVHTVSTTGMTPGVYVLRLINGNDVKTQKIVVR